MEPLSEQNYEIERLRAIIGTEGDDGKIELSLRADLAHRLVQRYDEQNEPADLDESIVLNSQAISGAIEAGSLQHAAGTLLAGFSWSWKTLSSAFSLAISAVEDIVEGRLEDPAQLRRARAAVRGEFNDTIGLER